MNRTAKTVRVKTWYERPASEIFTPVLELAGLVEVLERAPPTAWRTSDRTSEGMNSIKKNLGLQREYSTPKAFTLQEQRISRFLDILPEHSGDGNRRDLH